MRYRFIITKKENSTFYLTLARPEKRNAFTPTMVNEIAHAIAVANQDDEVKSVILEAEGPVFCAGMDLRTFEDVGTDEINPAIQNQDLSLGEVFDRLLKPSIAIVKGDVIAGGFLIILGCTYVFTQQNVRFRLPELTLGIFPFQVMASLLKVLPEKKALQLCLDTDYFSAEKAKDLGIIDGFLEDMDVNALVNSFASARPDVLKAGIKSLREISSMPREKHYSYLKHILDELKKKP